MKKIVVVGGGPAGMMAAYAAAANGGLVTLIDRNDKLANKLLLTGNGKCNYSNEDMSFEYYNFDETHPFAEIINKYNPLWLERFFEEKGMLTYKKENLLYPKSEKATSVKDLLEKLLADEKINIICGNKVVNVSKDSNEYTLTLEDSREIKADRLIIATGGKAYPSTGSDGGGYRLARTLGHKVEFTYPVLTRLISKDKGLTKMGGVRIKALVKAIVNDEEVAKENGEIQFTKEGLSGICIFNLSRFISKPLEEKCKCQVAIDFVPEMSKEELAVILNRQEDVETFLRINFGEKTADLINDKLINHDYVEAIKNLLINIDDHDSFSNAQVTKGGVNINEVDGNLESRISQGLYFAGEVLDVDGKCGGYNLHWAFVSGYQAGINAAK